MADNRRYLLNPQLDISQILLEAQHRWLRPSEICEILSNYQKFHLTPDPPCKPPSGSLFLFDRKALRYFRKDGHCWRKKKDGKTVREAHEKLKSGSVDVLHCYYAHGEENENFQRRSYWMLEEQLEHIVLVHYREVKEGHRSGTFHLLNTEHGIVGHTGGAQSSSPPCSAQAISPVFTAQLSCASTPSTAHWNGQAPSTEPEDVDSGDDYGISSLSGPATCSGFQISPLQVDESTDKSTSGNEGCSVSSRRLGEDLSGGAGFDHDVYPSLLSDRSIASMHKEKLVFGHRNGADFFNRKLINSISDPSMHTVMRAAPQGGQEVESFQCVDLLSGRHMENDRNYTNALLHDRGFDLTSQFDKGGLDTNITTSKQSLGFESEGHQSLENAVESSLQADEGSLKKLDSFGRWMNKEIGKDCDDSLMASESCKYWNDINADNDEKEVSSLSRHMQLDTDSLGPSLSQEQLFSILEFSPHWSYSRVETKVLIIGTFLGGLEHPIRKNWCCMFGKVEVSAEVLSNNVLRCQAPAHSPGLVPFYITCSNRLACSEVREFEYREKPSYSIATKNDPREEMRLQIRLAKMLFLGADRKHLDCSVQQCEKCKVKSNTLSMKARERSGWCMVEKSAIALEGNREKPKDALIQKLLEDRLYQWLVCRTHEEGKGPNVLDDDGQGIIHLAAALGYDWAMGPIVAAGVNPSFRDAHGRTGLHWAAYFGREETVGALVSLGAAAGAVEDPTSSFPEGRTAADLASSRGHKGIAGYLAEADLTSHLSSLTLKDGIMDDLSATLAAEKAVEMVEKQSIIPLDGDKDSVSLKGSLAAMRNSAQAAAQIQSAFHVYSFRQRQLKECSDDNHEIRTDLVALASLSSKPQKVGHFSDSLHAAAIRIQQKYRGWKGQKEFLKIHNRIVKIQAHVRGHQVRKQYKKVIWSVGIVEKAILRWRRRGAGLRGFQADKAIRDADMKTGKVDEYDFLRVGRKQKTAVVEKALARVQSMVHHPEAREQYMRLATNFQKSKMMTNEGNESVEKQS